MIRRLAESRHRRGFAEDHSTGLDAMAEALAGGSSPSVPPGYLKNPTGTRLHGFCAGSVGTQRPLCLGHGHHRQEMSPGLDRLAARSLLVGGSRGGRKVKVKP